MQWVGNKVVMDMRVATFAHLQELSMRYFSKSKTGELISRTINDSMMIERAVSVVLGALVKGTPSCCWARQVSCSGWIPRWPLPAWCCFPSASFPLRSLAGACRRYAKHGQERLASLVSIMQEALMGIRIVKAFGMESYEVARFTEQCQLFFNRIMRVTRDKAIIEPLIVFISMIGLALVLFYARWVHMPVENLLVFAFGSVLLYDPVKKLSKIHLHIQQTSASADRIFEILDTPVAIKDTTDTRVLRDPHR